MFDINNESMTRIKTGLVLIAAMLVLGYIDSFFLFWLVFGAMLMISISESKTLYTLKSDSIYVYTAIMWFIAYFYPMPTDLIFVLAIAYASQLAYKRTLNKKLFLPLLYPTASFLFLLTLYSQYGVKVLLWLLVIVASTDIGAYFIGKGFGKTKFSETSPNKTIEGVIGGVSFAVILGSFFLAISQLPHSYTLLFVGHLDLHYMLCDKQQISYLLTKPDLYQNYQSRKFERYPLVEVLTHQTKKL